MRMSQNLKRVSAFAEKKPFTSFFITLGILLLIILLGSTIFKTKTSTPATRVEPKQVEVYRLGGVSTVAVQAQVKKSGVVKIVAQTPGIVNTIKVTEGEYVEKGKTLIFLSSNYQGANAFTIQRQLAGVAYQNTKESYDIQKDLIARQRDLANRSSDNSEELRKLTRQSIDDTRNLINQNGEIISNLQAQIENPPQGASVDQLKQVKAQLQAGQNQLQAALRASEYQVDEKKPAVDLERIGKDIALKQLEIQEKAIKMGLDAAGLQLRLAQVQESTMYPSAPFGSTVQKIHVKVGDAINPGMPLITLSSDTGDIMLDAQVPMDIAEKVARNEKATVEVGSKKIEMIPTFVSTEATSGQLYSVVFTVDSIHKKYFTDSSYVKVNLPVASKAAEGNTPFIPVDSVFQTQEESYVYVVNGGKAVSKKVKLGAVTGGYVAVNEGLSTNDQIILNRTVIDGDAIKVQN